VAQVKRSTGIIGPILPNPPLRYAVALTAKGNDSTQKIALKGRTVTVSGVAKNEGRNPSVARFTIAGKRYAISTPKGMTPLQLALALEKKLPDDLSVQILSTPRPGNSVVFNVMRGGKETISVPNLVRQAVADGGASGSQAGTLVSKAELQHAVRVAMADDGKFGDDEKMAFAQSWAALFTGGAGFLATPAAQKEYARLEKKHDLPVLGIM
jgi:hypothetical protein